MSRLVHVKHFGTSHAIDMVSAIHLSQLRLFLFGAVPSVAAGRRRLGAICLPKEANPVDRPQCSEIASLISLCRNMVIHAAVSSASVKKLDAHW